MDTSTGVARVVTDQGKAYMKAMGNPAGPHALVREYVCTALAEWYGLPTFEYAVVHYDGDVVVPFANGTQAMVGPAFVTRAHCGREWGGEGRELNRLDNSEDITHLVVFDTLVLNHDRYPPDGMQWQPNRGNVFFSSEGASEGRYRLVAMDFSVAFGSGSMITPAIGYIGTVKDERIYGLFPAFRSFLDRSSLDEAIDRLRELQPGVVNEIMRNVPREWGLGPSERDAVRKLLSERSGFLAEHLLESMRPHFEKQDDLGL